MLPTSSCFSWRLGQPADAVGSAGCAVALLGRLQRSRDRVGEMSRHFVCSAPRRLDLGQQPAARSAWQLRSRVGSKEKEEKTSASSVPTESTPTASAASSGASPGGANARSRKALRPAWGETHSTDHAHRHGESVSGLVWGNAFGDKWLQDGALWC